MKTKIVKINPTNPEKKLIKEAARTIKSGGLLVYPTETCYGLGADATKIKTVKKVFKVKKRSHDKPIPILVSDLEMMKKYGKVTEEIKFLAKKFLPGPLTIITEKKKTIPNILNSKEIGFRISKHPVASALVREVGVPITTTSANISGQPPLYKIKDIIRIFYEKVEMILDCGNLKKRKPSTVFHVKSKKIIREGSISGRTLLRELKDLKRAKD